MSAEHNETVEQPTQGQANTGQGTTITSTSAPSNYNHDLCPFLRQAWLREMLEGSGITQEMESDIREMRASPRDLLEHFGKESEEEDLVVTARRIKNFLVGVESPRIIGGPREVVMEDVITFFVQLFVEGEIKRNPNYFVPPGAPGLAGLRGDGRA